MSAAPGPERLLYLFVRMMLAAERAELFEFNTLGRRLLVLHACVIFPLTFRALEGDLFTCHISAPN